MISKKQSFEVVKNKLWEKLQENFSGKIIHSLEHGNITHTRYQQSINIQKETIFPPKGINRNIPLDKKQSFEIITAKLWEKMQANEYGKYTIFLKEQTITDCEFEQIMVFSSNQLIPQQKYEIKKNLKKEPYKPQYKKLKVLQKN